MLPFHKTPDQQAAGWIRGLAAPHVPAVSQGLCPRASLAVRVLTGKACVQCQV